MASKVKKGFLYYLVWLVVIVVGIACIFASILLFNPNKDVFGIGLRYISHLNTESINQITVNGEKKNIKDLEIEKFNFVSGYGEFNVINDASYSQITLAVNKKTNGFSNDKDYDGCYLKFNYENKVLNIEIVEPKYWLPLSQNVIVTVFIPNTYSLGNKDLSFTSTSGNITPIHTDSTSVISINKLDINTVSGAVTIYNKTNVMSGIVNIDCETSKVNVYCDVKDQLNLNTKYGKIYIDNIAGNLTINAEKLDAKCQKIGGNVSYSCKTGFIRIGKLGTELSGGNFSAEIDKQHIADVVIEEMTGNLSIPNAEMSNIMVDKLGGIALIDTTSGNVNIGNSQNQITIKTKSGSVNLTQTSTFARTDVETESGKIVANFEDVGDVSLKSKSGTIEVNVKTDLQFIFKYSTEKEIKVSWITTSLEKEGTIYVGLNENETTANVIDAKTNSGKISLKDGFELE